MFTKMLPQYSGINTEIEILLGYEPLDTECNVKYKNEQDLLKWISPQ